MRRFLLFLFFAAHVFQSWSSTWIVGPSGSFADINAAMSSSSVKDGDVLRIPAGVTIGTTSASQTVTKCVIIEGQGYARNAAGEIQNKATVVNLVLQQDEALVTKLCLEGYVRIRANDLTIEKCFVNCEIQATARNYDSDNLTVRQCLVTNLIRGLNSAEYQTGWHIHNNIFTSTATSNVNYINATNGGVIDHNIFYHQNTSGSTNAYSIKYVGDCTVKDNIFLHFLSDSNHAATFDGTVMASVFNENTVVNNVFTGVVTYTGNKGGITKEADVFVWGTPSNPLIETNYVLCGSSLAKACSSTGGDCGPWTGTHPYLIGGLTEAPVISDEFQVEANDLLALKNMYNAFGGASWTTKKWNIADNGKSKDDFPGVTFTDEGRVTAIDLQDNGLEGDMFNVYSPSFAELTSLNLSYNRLSGDVSKFVVNLPKLRTLNMAYNRITEATSGIPSTCSSVNLQYQNRDWNSSNALTANFQSLAAKQLTIKTNDYFFPALPTLFAAYKQDRWLYEPTDLTNAKGKLASRSADNAIKLSLYGGYLIYTFGQDRLMAIVQESGVTSYSAYPVRLHFVPGDADMNGVTNVLDVQYTLTYILAASTLGYFNYSAANTYSDNQINVQDIVATVNIVLGNGGAASARGDGFSGTDGTTETDGTAETAEGAVFARDGQLLLSAQRPVAAIDVELEGVSTDEVGLMLPSRDFMMIGRNTEWGSRYVIFSPTGKSIAANAETPLLRLAGYAQPVAIMCSDPEAKSVAMTIDTVPTGIMSKTADGATAGDETVYDLQGRRHTGGRLAKGLYIHDGNKTIIR